MNLKAAPTFDPEDPNKGQFGGQSIANGRKLRAIRTDGSQEEGWLEFQFVVEPLAGTPPLAGSVVYHLHPTFRNDTVVQSVKLGKAILKRWAYGAFTVGVVADNGQTRLELDLAEESSLPLWFRRQ